MREGDKVSEIKQFIELDRPQITIICAPVGNVEHKLTKTAIRIVPLGSVAQFFQFLGRPVCHDPPPNKEESPAYTSITVYKINTSCGESVSLIPRIETEDSFFQSTLFGESPLVLCSQSLFRFADLSDDGLCRGGPDKGCGVIVSAIDVVVDRLD